MKIGTYAPVIPLHPRQTEKTGDQSSGSGSNPYERQSKKEKDDENEFEATIEEVDAALEKFASDETASTHGITAQSTGQGPGLKVVLKDASGGVLRSVSGEEFLKLREAASAGRKSGRILDQKA